MIQNTGHLVDLLKRVFGPESLPKPFDLIAAFSHVEGGASIAEAAKLGRTTKRRLSLLLAATDPVAALLGGEIPALSPEVEARTRQALGQLLIGNIAERVFEEVYKDTVGTSELALRDDRGARGETDYLVFNGQGRQVFRINIKFHGSQFRRALDLVGLQPEDCFALATYKIHAALNRQNAEHLPYIFVIVGVPSLTGSGIGSIFQSDLVHLAALPRLSPRITGIRTFEDRVVDAVVEDSDRFDLTAAVDEYLGRIRSANWFVLSSRRADMLLHEKLFERVFALRVRGFAQNYRAAELDMHFSMSNDLTPLADFLAILRDHGMPGLVSRLERGTL